jgi:hypothetical protein
VSGASETRATLERWLRARLTEGEGPKDEWRQVLEAAWGHLLATKVHDLVDADASKALADRLADPELVTELSRPIVATAARAMIAELRKDEEPIDRFLSPEAQQQLQETLSRPGLVHPDWVRAIFRGEAAEAVLNDALYRALREFSTLLPRLMVKVSPMGRFGVIGGAGALAEKLIEEIEKLAEPEIRSFLADGTERLLERAAEFTIAKLDDPASIEFRHNLATFILSKSPAFYLDVADEELLDEMGVVVELAARHVAQMPEVRAGAHMWIDRVLESSANKTLGEVLQIEGTDARPPMDALAEATWPAFRTMLNSPQPQRWMDTLLNELLDEYERIKPEPE